MPSSNEPERPATGPSTIPQMQPLQGQVQGAQGPNLQFSLTPPAGEYPFPAGYPSGAVYHPGIVPQMAGQGQAGNSVPGFPQPFPYSPHPILPAGLVPPPPPTAGAATPSAGTQLPQSQGGPSIASFPLSMSPATGTPMPVPGAPGLFFLPHQYGPLPGYPVPSVSTNTANEHPPPPPPAPEHRILPVSPPVAPKAAAVDPEEPVWCFQCQQWHSTLLAQQIAHGLLPANKAATETPTKPAAANDGLSNEMTRAIQDAIAAQFAALNLNKPPNRAARGDINYAKFAGSTSFMQNGPPSTGRPFNHNQYEQDFDNARRYPRNITPSPEEYPPGSFPSEAGARPQHRRAPSDYDGFTEAESVASYVYSDHTAKANDKRGGYAYERNPRPFSPAGNSDEDASDTGLPLHYLPSVPRARNEQTLRSPQKEKQMRLDGNRSFTERITPVKPTPIGPTSLNSTPTTISGTRREEETYNSPIPQHKSRRDQFKESKRHIVSPASEDYPAPLLPKSNKAPPTPAEAKAAVLAYAQWYTKTYGVDPSFLVELEQALNSPPPPTVPPKYTAHRIDKPHVGKSRKKSRPTPSTPPLPIPPGSVTEEETDEEDEGPVSASELSSAEYVGYTYTDLDESEYTSSSEASIATLTPTVAEREQIQKEWEKRLGKKPIMRGGATGLSPASSDSSKDKRKAEGRDLLQEVSRKYSRPSVSVKKISGENKNAPQRPNPKKSADNSIPEVKERIPRKYSIKYPKKPRIDIAETPERTPRKYSMTFSPSKAEPAVSGRPRTPRSYSMTFTNDKDQAAQCSNPQASRSVSESYTSSYKSSSFNPTVEEIPDDLDPGHGWTWNSELGGYIDEEGVSVPPSDYTTTTTGKDSKTDYSDRMVVDSGKQCGNGMKNNKAGGETSHKDRYGKTIREGDVNSKKDKKERGSGGKKWRKSMKKKTSVCDAPGGWISDDSMSVMLGGDPEEVSMAGGYYGEEYNYRGSGSCCDTLWEDALESQ